MRSNKQHGIKKKIVKKVIKQHLKENIPIKTATNAKFNKDQILNPLFGAISSKEFVESYVEDLREDHKNVPSSDTIFYRLEESITLLDVMNSYNTTNDKILTNCAALGVFNDKIDRGIDCHDTPWYGKDKKHAVTTNQIRGTKYAHRYMSIELIEKPRLTIHAVLMNQFSNRSECLKELLLKAKKWLPEGGINHLDRGFFDAPSISVLLQLHEDFIIAGKRNSKIDKIIRKVKDTAEFVSYQYIPKNLRQKKAYYSFHVEPYTMGEGKKSVTFNLVILFTQYDNPDKKDEIFIFGTNLKVTQENVLILSEGYRKRWGIETGYRVKKEVKGKTNSPNYVIRVLFQMLSIVLYNLWILCNILLSEFIIVKKGYPITMCRLRKILRKIVSVCSTK